MTSTAAAFSGANSQRRKFEDIIEALDDLRSDALLEQLSDGNVGH